MKKNLRGKIREFVQSEEGKVGMKSPLTLGGRAPQGRVFMKYSPTWSPDGKWIAYVSDNVEFQHKSSIYIVDAAGEEHAESIRLTTHLSENISPTWVPDLFFAVSPSAEKITTLWGKLKSPDSSNASR